MNEELRANLNQKDFEMLKQYYQWNVWRQLQAGSRRDSTRYYSDIFEF